MRRIAKVLGIGMVLTALLAVSITGAALAAGGNTADNDCVPNLYESPGPHGAQNGIALLADSDVAGNGNQGEECPYNDCVPNFYNWDHNYESPGPHGNGTALAAGSDATDNGNQGEECPCGDCVPNAYNWDYSYQSPGPNGAQNGKVS
ncbi:MAG: hypothetical protein FJ004_00115 [Chloroflexi bacterium]|nr:hypothetical protein [Chloroflexota bacterium]